MSLEAIIYWMTIPAVGGLAAAAAKLVDLWMARRRQTGVEVDSFSVRMNLLTDQMQEELTRTRARNDGYDANLEVLRSARWSLEDAMARTHSAAIAARAMVHELQRRLGEAETAFPPLPRPGHPEEDPR